MKLLCIGVYVISHITILKNDGLVLGIQYIEKTEMILFVNISFKVSYSDLIIIDQTDSYGLKEV